MSQDISKAKMMRVKAVISYNGSKYFGFQKQKSTKETIVSAFEVALHNLNIDSQVTGSGRTDAGVHASGQVIHFDIPTYWQNLQKLKCNLNRQLNTIYVKHITYVTDDFHARFSAKKRIYRYVFKTTKPSVFEQAYVSHYSTFDTQLLQKALQQFKGKHDFKYFRKTGSPTHTTVREIYRAFYIKIGEYHFIYFEANAFLRAQVRMMVETSMAYAQDKLTLQELTDQLLCKYHHQTKLAPPYGLFLARIIYPI